MSKDSCFTSSGIVGTRLLVCPLVLIFLMIRDEEEAFSFEVIATAEAGLTFSLLLTSTLSLRFNSSPPDAPPPPLWLQMSLTLLCTCWRLIMNFSFFVNSSSSRSSYAICSLFFGLYLMRCWILLRPSFDFWYSCYMPSTMVLRPSILSSFGVRHSRGFFWFMGFKTKPLEDPEVPRAKVTFFWVDY